MSGGLPLLSSKQTLLTMIQNAYNELGLGVSSPTFIIGNTDPQVTQLFALANREGKTMYTAGFKFDGWQVLRKEYTFTINAVSGLTGNFTSGSPVVTNILPNTTGITSSMQPYNTTYVTPSANILTIDSSTQITMTQNAIATSPANTAFFCGQTSYPFPSDIDHFMTQTFWDRNFRWQLLGPLDGQEWQVLKSGISPTGPRRRFRMFGNTFNIDPVPGFSSSDNGSIEAFEYFSNGWCQSTGGTTGTPQQKFQADTDNYVLDDELMTLGIIWRFLRAKRLSYDEEKMSYDLLAERVMARDGSNRNLPLNASASGIRLLNAMNVPDTGFGS